MPVRREFALPRDDLERELATIFEEVLGRPAGATSNFFDLGGRSISAILVLLQIEKRCHVSLPPATLLEAPTVEQLADRLRKRGHPGSALVAFRSTGERPPIFFVHGADGSVFYYRRLAEHLGPEWPFYGLQTTGRIPASNEELAASYIAEVKIVQPQGPYFLGGYCMGGTVAFEMARQLRSTGEEVGLLALVDTYDWSRISAPGLGVQQLAYLPQKLDFHRRNFLLLSGRERGLFLRGKARWAVGLASLWRGRRNARDRGVIDEALVHLLMSYVPRFYPGRLTHFRSMAAYAQYQERELSAGVHAASVAREEIPVYPGGILVEPFVRRLAERMRACVA
jgi:phthiocerol/phenolphthiocerol synthesis type-I polyketide synthase E